MLATRFGYFVGWREGGGKGGVNGTDKAYQLVRTKDLYTGTQSFQVICRRYELKAN